MRAVVMSLVLGLVMAVSALAETRVVNAPGDGFLNLRTGPGTSYQIILPMTHGSQVEVFEYAGKWMRVQHQPTGAMGWAHGRFLLPAPSGSSIRQGGGLGIQSDGGAGIRRDGQINGGPPQMIVADPKDGWLNLRAGPGTRYQVLLRMWNGDRVDVHDTQGKWAKVYHHNSGTLGWAYLPYMRR